MPGKAKRKKQTTPLTISNKSNRELGDTTQKQGHRPQGHGPQGHHNIITLRDGAATRVFFDEHGKELGSEKC